ncbi:MAG: ribokinase [Woeseiaceae bacterium]
MSGRQPSIVVVGSVNLDMAASVSRLPRPGETVSGADLRRFPGGKGANQALAARRLGADVKLIARVGHDAEADAALALLQAGGVDLSRCLRDAALPTGVALIAIAPEGENLIVVAPGANRALRPETLELPAADALMCQLEVPADTLCFACEQFDGFFCVNLAPAMEVPQEILRRADLIVVNETEAAFYGDALDACRGMVAITHGAGDAVLSKQRTTLATSTPPQVIPVDTTGAGDTFAAALTIALLEGMTPAAAMDFACTAAALATTRHGAQTSLPYRKDVEAFLSRPRGRKT